MILTTEQEYITALNKYCQETIAIVNARKPLYPLSEELQTLSDAIDVYQDTHSSYEIICTKSHYAGQGIDFQIGDCWGNSHSRLEAENNLRILNRSWSANCWEIREIPPKIPMT